MYYAIRNGIRNGIFTTWDECKKYTQGYSNADFKKFKTLQEAEDYLDKDMDVTSINENKYPYAFIDGSYNTTTGVYGYGGFIQLSPDKQIDLKGNGSNHEMSKMRNVAGEIMGAIAAVMKAEQLGLTHLTIYYDYLGIEKWATGEWKRNKNETIAYYNFMQNTNLIINFVKVKGHSGVKGNERADQLAKMAVGLI